MEREQPFMYFLFCFSSFLKDHSTSYIESKQWGGKIMNMRKTNNNNKKGKGQCVCCHCPERDNDEIIKMSKVGCIKSKGNSV